MTLDYEAIREFLRMTREELGPDGLDRFSAVVLLEITEGTLDTMQVVEADARGWKNRALVAEQDRTDLDVEILRMRTSLTRYVWALAEVRRLRNLMLRARLLAPEDPQEAKDAVWAEITKALGEGGFEEKP